MLQELFNRVFWKKFHNYGNKSIEKWMAPLLSSLLGTHYCDEPKVKPIL